MPTKPKQEIPQLHPCTKIHIFAKRELQAPLLAFTKSQTYLRLSPVAKIEALRQKERELLAQKRKLSQETLFDLEQVHGTKAFLVTGERQSSPPRADALFTAKAGLSLVVRTADCLPIFFVLEEKNSVLVVGIVHSGWRGTKDKIVTATLQEMLVYAQSLAESQKSENWKSKANWKLSWAIGPAISQKNYEVSDEVATHFRHTRASNRKNHFLLDLSAEIHDQVRRFCENNRLEETYNQSWEACVYEKTHRYFSHRRDDPFRNLNMIEIIAPKGLA